MRRRRRGARAHQDRLAAAAPRAPGPEGKFPLEKGSTSTSQNPLNKPESGTCSICSAPCSSCTHHNCASSVMESYIGSVPSGNTSTIKEEESDSCIGGSDHIDKNKASGDHEHISSETIDRFSSKKIDGEQHGPECHNDDVSCIPEIKDASDGAVKKSTRRRSSRNKVKEVIANKDSVDSHNHSKEVDQIGDTKFVSQPDKSVHGRTGRSDLPEKDSSHNSSNDGFPSLSRNLEEQDHSRFSKDLANCVSESPTDNAKSLLVEEAAGASICKQDAPHLLHGGIDGKPADLKDSRSDMCEQSNLLEVDSDVQVAGAQRKIITNDGSFGEIKGDAVDAQEKATSSEDRSSDEEEVEDVKVCDICGDVGEEQKLAVCTRCNDGAEHIYCMRVMMQEVPAGEWLCEECQYEVEIEKEKKKLEKSQVKVGVSKGPSFEEKMEKPVNASKLKGSSANEVEAENVGPKESEKANQGSGVATKRKEEDPGIASLGRQKLPDLGVLSGDVADSRKRMPPSREASFNLDVEKAKQISGHAQTPLASNSPRSQAPPVHGQLSKSISFNNSKIPKVKQLVNEVPQKPKNLKVSSTSIMKKEKPTSMLTKSASFKNTNSSEAANKTKSSIFPHAEEPKLMKQPMDRNVMNNKSTSILGRPSISSSVAAPVPPKTDSAAQHPTKGNNMADSNNLGVGQGPGRHSELKKPFLVKAPGNISLNSADKSTGILGSGVQRKVTQVSDPSHRDDKIKNPPSLRPGASSGSRTIRCQRCNEAGHSTQFCAVDKLRTSAIKPLSERNLKDGSAKRNKTSEATTSIATEQAAARSVDQSEHILKFDPNHDPVFRTKLSLSTSSSHGKKQHMMDVPTSEKDMRSNSTPSSSTAATNCNRPKCQDQETECAMRGRAVDVTCTMLNDPRDKTQIFSSQAFAPVDGSTASTIPELEYIWQGVFEVLRTGRSPELCDGLQAHLSSSASPRVLEAANSFPSKIQLEEVPRQNSWPLQFQKNGPRNDNIGIFFFARDIQSYENHYSKLVENMLKNDFVLRANIEAVELLIFTSNLLPKNAQKWNKFYFLWGVFRVRRKDCIKDSPDVSKSECESDLKKDLMAVDQVTSVLSSGHSPSQGLNDCAKPDLNLVKSNTCLDPLAPQSLEADHCEHLNDGKPSEDQHHGSFSKNNSANNSLNCHDSVAASSAGEHQKIASLEPQDKIWDSSHGNGGEGIFDVNAVPVACSVFSVHEGNRSTTNNFNKTEPLLDANHANTTQVSSGLMDPSSHVSGDSQKHASGDPLKRNVEMANWADEANTRELKKVKLDNELVNSGSCEDVRDGRLLSKVHPLAASEDDGTDDKVMAVSLKSDRKCTFPLDLNAVEDTTSGDFIVLSSDDEELPGRDAPDLELALGDTKSPKKALLPFLSPRVEERQDQGDKRVTDSPSSLSLSLAFPASEKAQAGKPRSQPQRQLPERATSKVPFSAWDP